MTLYVAQYPSSKIAEFRLVGDKVEPTYHAPYASQWFEGDGIMINGHTSRPSDGKVFLDDLKASLSNSSYVAVTDTKPTFWED